MEPDPIAFVGKFLEGYSGRRTHNGDDRAAYDDAAAQPKFDQPGSLSWLGDDDFGGSHGVQPNKGESPTRDGSAISSTATRILFNRALEELRSSEEEYTNLLRTFKAIYAEPLRGAIAQIDAHRAKIAARAMKRKVELPRKTTKVETVA